ncbi:MAG TPA: tetratricopeptide repeat protein [Candidatus Omnitrophota bacterium]|nr:tetratricopeptide repeat protein [Candidatus Omnitrophota bacterium]
MVAGIAGVGGIFGSGYNPADEIPGQAKASYNLGRRLYDGGNYDEALKQYAEALAKAQESNKPNNKAPAIIYMSMAECYAQKGEYEKAIQALKSAKAETKDEKLLAQIDGGIADYTKAAADKKPDAAVPTKPGVIAPGPKKQDKAVGSPEGRPEGEQASPPKPFEVNNAYEALRLLGINIDAKEVDENHDGTVSDEELNKYLRAKGVKIDVTDGFQWEEVDALAKKYGVTITKAYFDTLSTGGTSVDGDNTVTVEDAAKFNKRVIQRLSQGTGKPEELIKKYMATESFKMMDAGQAVSEFSGRFGKDTALYGAGGQVSVSTLVSAYVRPELQDAACIVLSNILGKPVKKDDIAKNELKLAPDQLTTFFLTMYVLGKSDKPGELLVPSAASLPKLEKESPLGFLEWLTTGTKNKVDAPKEEKKAGETGRSSDDSKTITPEEAQKLQTLLKSGNTAKTIDYLEELEKKYPENILIKEMLAEQYSKKGEAQKALEKISYVYEKDPTPDRKKTLAKCAIDWYQQVNGKTLTAEQKALATKTLGTLKAMADAETDKALQAQFKLLVSAYSELKEDPLPGQIDFQAAITKDGAKLSDVKTAYDKFAETLAAGIVEERAKASPDKARLAKMYGRLALIEMSRRNYAKAREYATELVKLYPSLEGEAKDKAKAQIKDIVEKLCQYRHVDRVKDARAIIEEAEKQKVLDDLAITITVQAKAKKGLSTSTEDKTVKSASDLDDMIKESYRPAAADEAAIYIQGLPGLFAKMPKGAGRVEMMLPVMYTLGDKGCLKEIDLWSSQFAKSRNIPAGNPKNPAGKFKSMQSAEKYLQWLIDNVPYESPKSAAAAGGGDA